MKKILVFLTINILIMRAFSQSLDSVNFKYLIRESNLVLEHPPVLIMLHGVGSNESDLFSFANRIDKQFTVISIQAPYQYGNNGFSWYSVSFPNGKPLIDNDQAEKSRVNLIKFIDQITEKHTIDTNNIYLMGFSQGAIMAFSVGLTRPDKVTGIACFSGRVLKQTKGYIADKKELSNLKVLVVHSTNDPVLNYQYAVESTNLLELNNIQYDFITDSVGHSISLQSLERFNAWLK
jgi:phospholipase/carboxylesterase